MINMVNISTSWGDGSTGVMWGDGSTGVMGGDGSTGEVRRWINRHDWEIAQQA